MDEMTTKLALLLAQERLPKHLTPKDWMNDGEKRFIEGYNQGIVEAHNNIARLICDLERKR